MKTLLYIDYSIAILLIILLIGPYIQGFFFELFNDMKPMRQNIRPDSSNLYWKRKHINLCDNCKYNVAICKAIDLEFGTGTGNDNIISCDYYIRKETLIERYSNKYLISLLIILVIVIGVFIIVFDMYDC